MKLTALGTADAFSSGGRFSTAWLVDDDRGTYAVDFGPTAMVALRKLGRDPLEIDVVHFTHLHGDHIAGWPFLLLEFALKSKRTRPLSVTGPKGTRERLQALWQACYADTAQRELPFKLVWLEIEPDQSARVAGREVHAFRAQHMSPPHVALAYRIDRLAFTGDTGRIDDRLCEGAEWLCCECTDLEPGSAKHLNWRQFPAPPVKKIFVAHLGEEARREARGSETIEICDDLQSYQL